MKKRNNIIYAYLEPREDHPQFSHIRYIGSSTIGEKRPLDYLPGHDFGKVGPWIRKCGGTVPWAVLEYLPDDLSLREVFDIETVWIRRHKAIGEADKNLKDTGLGGNGGACLGTKRNKESRLLMSKRQIERFSCPEERKKTASSAKESQNRPEVKRKKSEAQKRAMARPEQKAKRAATDALPEVRARRSAMMKNWWLQKKANSFNG